MPIKQLVNHILNQFQFVKKEIIKYVIVGPEAIYVKSINGKI